ncbi:MAG: hypothetical protein WCW17_03575 [Patescibacteria group bacterium]
MVLGVVRHCHITDRAQCESCISYRKKAKFVKKDGTTCQAPACLKTNEPCSNKWFERVLPGVSYVGPAD